MNGSVFYGQDGERRLREPSSRVREAVHSLRDCTVESQVGHAQKSGPSQPISGSSACRPGYSCLPRMEQPDWALAHSHHPQAQSTTQHCHAQALLLR